MSSSSLELRVLAQLMAWNDDEMEREFRWLRLMSRFKYDAYSDFIAGARFTASLIQWLKQFGQKDRQAAYSFARKRLVFIGAGEMQHLVESFYPDRMEPILVDRLASARGIKHPYQVRRTAEFEADLTLLRHRTLLIGMSEGASLDPLRRANTGILLHERMLPSVEMDDTKWTSALKKMRKSLEGQAGAETARFSDVFLIDDFVGSGTTFFRKESDGALDGKLTKFVRQLKQIMGNGTLLLDDDACINVHHYIGSKGGRDNLEKARETAEAYILDETKANYKLRFTYGWILPDDVVVDKAEPDISHLVNDYYNKDIETDHNTAGGGTTTDIRWGYKECCLCIVMEHNTPNNSLPLIWGHTDGPNGHSMRALFRRRQRHG